MAVGLLEGLRWRSSAHSQRERLAAHWSSALFFLAALATAAYCLGDYSINWMHPETWTQQRVYFNNRAHLSWDLWPQFFNCEIISGGGCTRARLLSYLISYVNAFFRLWLVDYIPPHPSLSLNWAISIASIYFLYRIILDLTGDRSSAFLGAGLYVLSAGFLSNLIFLFHPAKPLAGFFVNVCLFLAIGIGRSRQQTAYSARAILLYACLLLAYFSDETTWILWIAIPILCPYLLERERWPLLVGVIGSFPLFLALVTWAVPLLVKSYWSYDFTFWNYILNVGSAAEPNSPPMLERFDINRLSAAAQSIVTSQHAWWQSGSNIAMLSVLPVAGAIGAAASVAKREMRALLLRTVLLLAVFLVFQCLLLLRHYHAIGSGTFYYGALYANFFVLVVGVAMACIRDVWGANIIRTMVAMYLGYVSFTWCMTFNAAWIPLHYPDELKVDSRNLRADSPSTLAGVADYWRAVRRGEDVRWVALAPKDLWLFDLMDSWRERHER